MTSPWRNHDTNEINYYIEHLLSNRKYDAAQYYKDNEIDDYDENIDDLED